MSFGGPEGQPISELVEGMIRFHLNQAYWEAYLTQGDIAQHGESPEVNAILSNANEDIKKYSVEAVTRILRGDKLQYINVSFDPAKPEVFEIICGSPRKEVVPWKKNLRTEILFEAGVISSPDELLTLARKPQQS